MEGVLFLEKKKLFTLRFLLLEYDIHRINISRYVTFKMSICIYTFIDSPYVKLLMCQKKYHISFKGL